MKRASTLAVAAAVLAVACSFGAHRTLATLSEPGNRGLASSYDATTVFVGTREAGVTGLSARDQTTGQALAFVPLSGPDKILSLAQDPVATDSALALHADGSVRSWTPALTSTLVAGPPPGGLDLDDLDATEEGEVFVVGVRTHPQTGIPTAGLCRHRDAAWVCWPLGSHLVNGPVRVTVDDQNDEVIVFRKDGAGKHLERYDTEGVLLGRASLGTREWYRDIDAIDGILVVSAEGWLHIAETHEFAIQDSMAFSWTPNLLEVQFAADPDESTFEALVRVIDLDGTVETIEAIEVLP